jgi:hypothetical protein
MPYIFLVCLLCKILRSRTVARSQTGTRISEVAFATCVDLNSSIHQGEYIHLDFLLLLNLFRNVVVKDMTILAPLDSPNTDGIDPGT